MINIKDDNWCRHIPTLHRVLADPDQISDFPQASGILELEDACAIWETLHYILTALLGWNSPGHGLAWWYSAGKPLDSTHWKIISDIWDCHHQLDYYAAWAWTPGRSFLSEDDLSSTDLAKTSLYDNEQWWSNFKRRGRVLRNDPFYGGSNPLHLGHSESLGLIRQHKEPDLYLDIKNRRAVLVTTCFAEWRSNLNWAARTLPPIGDRSWHVEVFDRHYGCLGVFRNSRITSQWFLGKHSEHMDGYIS